MCGGTAAPAGPNVTAMTTAPEPARTDLDLLREATDRLLASVEGLDAAAVAAPSVLPGWSRGHVLTHLARNADGVRTLALSARTGAPFGMYPGRPLRNADIDAGATRPADVILLDVRAAAERLAVELDAMSAEAWEASISPFAPTSAEPRLPAVALPGLRMREVEAHHIDLGLGYTWADSPAPMLASMLDQLPGRFSGADLAPVTVRATDLDRSWTVGAGGGPVIEGPAAAILSWATGRSAGERVACSAGPVPASPGWG